MPLGEVLENLPLASREAVGLGKTSAASGQGIGRGGVSRGTRGTNPRCTFRVDRNHRRPNLHSPGHLPRRGNRNRTPAAVTFPSFRSQRRRGLSPKVRYQHQCEGIERRSDSGHNRTISLGSAPPTCWPMNEAPQKAQMATANTRSGENSPAWATAHSVARVSTAAREYNP